MTRSSAGLDPYPFAKDGSLGLGVIALKIVSSLFRPDLKLPTYHFTGVTVRLQLLLPASREARF